MLYVGGPVVSKPSLSVIAQRILGIYSVYLGGIFT